MTTKIAFVFACVTVCAQTTGVHDSHSRLSNETVFRVFNAKRTDPSALPLAEAALAPGTWWHVESMLCNLHKKLLRRAEWAPWVT